MLVIHHKDSLADKGVPFNFPSTLFQDEDALIPLLCLLIAGFRLPPKGTVLRRDGRPSQGCGKVPRESSSTADVVKGGSVPHNVGTFFSNEKVIGGCGVAQAFMCTGVG